MRPSQSIPLFHLPLQIEMRIEQFWGEANTLIWHLNPDINILTGINGSGKSTLLRLLHDAFRNNFSEFRGTDIFDSLTLSISGQKQIFSKEELIEKPVLAEEEWDFSPYDHSLEAIFYDELDMIYLNTFEILLKDIEKKSVKNERIKTSLDLLLYEKGIRYVQYLKGLEAKSRHEGVDIEAIYQAKNRFLAIINESFSATHKQIKERSENSSFFFEKNSTGKKLSPFQFSSGEKQFFYLLLTALLQDNRPTIFILDEPEVSLHPEWQLNLIKYIRELNPNAMLVVATHSPEMLINGWLDKEFMMEELVKPHNLIAL